MAGLAAALRLAMFGREVLLLERHYLHGGLNSFFAKAGRKFDVGLHAVTNFPPPGSRKASPLLRLCRQLRLPFDSLDLSPQSFSRISFPHADLRFDNDFSLFLSEIERLFPSERDRFQKLLRHMEAFDAYSPAAPSHLSARKTLRDHLRDPLLVDMLLLPTCYYGSAIENDADLPTFVMLFDAIFRQGLARPYRGIRQLLDPILRRIDELGVHRRMNLGVRRLHASKGKVDRIELDNGETIRADHVVSTAGHVETQAMLTGDESAAEDEIGRITILESITCFSAQPAKLGWEETTVFYNDAPTLRYHRPTSPIEPRSGVICIPNNYRYPAGEQLPEGQLRVTTTANPDHWNSLPEAQYLEEKEQARRSMLDTAIKQLPDGPFKQEELDRLTTYVDVFTPRTIRKFTSHSQGALYGSPKKSRDGSTPLANLYLGGADQGYVGIVGAMLGGTAIANHRILKSG